MDDSGEQRLGRVIEWRIRRAVARREKALREEFKSRDRRIALLALRGVLAAGSVWLAERWGAFSGMLARLIERW